MVDSVSPPKAQTATAQKALRAKGFPSACSGRAGKSRRKAGIYLLISYTTGAFTRTAVTVNWGAANLNSTPPPSTR